MYGDGYDISDEQLPKLRKKLASLSELVRDIKVNFARYFTSSGIIESKEFVSSHSTFKKAYSEKPF
jgi:hypothetical protein